MNERDQDHYIQILLSNSVSESSVCVSCPSTMLAHNICDLMREFHRECVPHEAVSISKSTQVSKSDYTTRLQCGDWFLYVSG